MTNCTRCGEPKDVHDAGENYACQAQPTVTFQGDVVTPEMVEEVRSFFAVEADYFMPTGFAKRLISKILAMTNARDGTE